MRRLAMRMQHAGVSDVLPLAAVLFASSIFCGVLWIFRAHDDVLHPYFFMPFNLFLAWVPLPFAVAARSLALRRTSGARVLAIAAGAMWLAFLPNAPYVVTDIVHLRRDPDVPLWYDAALMGSFITTGLGLGYASLLVMQDAVGRLSNRAIAWAFAAGAISLSAFGIYLGRVLRWNSWDIFLAPGAVLRDVAAIFARPVAHHEAYVAWLVMAAFLWLGYLVVVAARGAGEPRHSREG